MIFLMVGLACGLLAALSALLLIKQDSRTIRRISLILSSLAGLSLSLFSLQVLISRRVIEVGPFDLVPQVQLAFRVDSLAALFILLISIVSGAVSLYSIGYIEESTSGPRRRLFVPLQVFFIFSMLFFVAADNLLTQLVFWELMSVLSFFLIMLNYRQAETPKSGLFYLVMTQMSTLFLLMAAVLIYGATGSFDLAPLASLSPLLNSVLFLLLLVGFGIKAGLMPFHKWLPYAHTSSPSSVSALMSGVMIKVAVYGLLRFTLDILTPQPWWGVLILALGTFSALMGVVYALKEHDIKRLLAYHSIENIGIILIAFGLYLIFQQYGLFALARMCLAASLLHSLNHALFKSLLFMTAGSVVEATSTRNIEKMGGLIKKMPWTAALFLTGAVAISALPPLNGFVSELMIFLAFFQAFTLANPFVIIFLFMCLSLFALTSALAAACFVKAFAMIFLAMPRSAAVAGAREATRSMLIGPAVPAVLCIVIGVGATRLFNWLGYPQPLPDLLFLSLILLFFGGLAALLLKLTARGGSRVVPTWACGLPAVDSRSEYTASGFSEPILTFFRPLYRTRKENKRTFWDRWSSVFKEGSLEIHTLQFFEEKLYLPVVRAVRALSDLVSRSQNVDLDTFILYSFITIVVLIIAAGWLL